MVRLRLAIVKNPFSIAAYFSISYPITFIQLSTCTDPCQENRISIYKTWARFAQFKTYVQDCMQVLFTKYFIFDRLICHFHLTSYMKELWVLW